MAVQIDTKKLAGMDEVRAAKLIAALGGIVHIALRDGVTNPNTDLRMNRVNLEIRNGVVVRAYVG